MTTKDTLIKKLQEKTAKIGILGMGYVGMPLAVVFAEAGFNVLGIDPDQRKVDTFNKGISYIQDVPTETMARLQNSRQPEHDRRFRRPEGDGRGQHLCADAAAPDRRPGYVVHHFGHRGTGEVYAQGHGGCAGIHHLSRHDARIAAAQSWRRNPA